MTRQIARRTITLVALVTLLGASAGTSRADDWRQIRPSPLRVLFVGNSLTEANQLPLLVQALAASRGEDLFVSAVTLGGASLEDHWHHGGALATIRREHWDYVVLQQGPSSLLESRVNLRQWTQEFAREIHAVGGRPALYMVWPDITRLEFLDDVRDSYSLAARDVKGTFFPAGEAWRAAWRRDPRAPLYAADNFHPSLAGSYAAALSIYGVLYRRPLVGLPAELVLRNGQAVAIPESLAALLQEAAEEANRRYGRS